MSRCQSLDEDSRYYPRKQGTYLRIDTNLWWLQEGSPPLQAPLSVHQIAAADRWAVALRGASVYLFQPGQLKPTHTLTLPEPGSCLAARVEKKTLTLYIGTPSGLLIGETQISKPAQHVRWSFQSTAAPVRAVAVAPSFTVAAAGQQLVVLDAEAHRLLQTIDLPGPILHLWIEHPTGAAGTWQGRDTLQGFQYLYTARQLLVDTTQPSPVRYRLTSPYLRANFGSEYTGAVQLTTTGLLTPGNHPSVESFSVDFLSGQVFFLRQDSLWRYATALPNAVKLEGTFSGAQEVEAVPVYRYGSAEVTTR